MVLVNFKINYQKHHIYLQQNSTVTKISSLLEDELIKVIQIRLKNSVTIKLLIMK